MADTIVALDLETIPRRWDDETIDNYITKRASRKRTGKDIEEKKSLFTLDYPFLVRPIAVSLVISPTGDSDEPQKPKIMGLFGVGDEFEAAFLETVSTNLRDVSPDLLVTYNGHSFDLPVLRMAYLLNELECPKILTAKRRYSNYPHYDVMQELMGWAYGKGFPLHMALHVWKIKHDDYYFNISDTVTALANCGDIGSISLMCSKHARATYELYKKMCPAPDEFPF